MKYFTNKWDRKVRDYCDSQYELIEVEPGDLNHYYKCHLVATDVAIKRNHDKLALVTYRYDGSLLPYVHFINYDGDRFIDNSMGVWSEKYEYRFIRWVPEAEFYDTVNILSDTQKVFTNMAGWLTKLFGEIGN